MPRFRKHTRHYIALAAALLLLTGLAYPAAAQPLAVEASLLNVRSGPGTAYSVLYQAPRGTVLTPLEREGSWVRVVLPDRGRGWVAAEWTAPFVPQGFATVNASLLNVRSRPGTNHPVIAQLEHRTSVAVLNEGEDGWLNVLLPGGGQGWLAGWYTGRASCRGYVTVTASLLNLRGGPGTGHAVLKQLPRNTGLAVLGQDGSWFKAALDDGTTGWVHGNYIAWREPSGGVKSPLNGMTIALDPGHGGYDPGAVGSTGLSEKTVNLAVALQLAPMLESAGARVILTRNADYGPGLWQRINLANTAGAHLFLSIHSNAHTQPWANGTETYYYAYGANSAKSRYLAQQLQQELVRTLGLRDLGVKTANFYVISYAAMPAALVELGFLTHYGDEAFLRQPQNQRRAAEALLRGLENYLR